MAFRVEITAPTAAELRAPSWGAPLVVRGVVLDTGLFINQVSIKVFIDNVPAVVSLVGYTWTATVYVKTSGNYTVSAKAFGKRSEGPVETPSVSLTVVVPPSQWQIPITFEVEGTPLIGADKAIVKVGADGKLLAVRVDPAHIRKSIVVRTSINNTESWPLGPQELGPWSGVIMLPAEAVPYDGKLIVREFDFFNEFNDTDYNFRTVDVTPPTITITEPKEDHVFVVPSGKLPFVVTFQGSVSDAQSRYKPDSLTYSFAGQKNIPVPPDNLGNGGLFSFEIEVTEYGPHTLTITAEDKSGNQTPPVVRQFELVSNYKSKTIEDLLAPRSYLDALLHFTRSHILDGAGNEVGATMLGDNFLLDFGQIAEPGSQVSSRTVNDLLTPVALLRQVIPTYKTGLIFRFTFDKPTGDPLLEFADEGPYRLGGGILKDGAKFSDPSTALGAVEFDGTNYALFGHLIDPLSPVPPNPGVRDTRAALAVGDNDQDFSVSFWIYVRDKGQPGGNWRGILYKGHEDATFTDVNRTFGIWLFPDSNTVYYRITTTDDIDAGGKSNTPIPVDQWTHVAYVRRGDRLQLFLDGGLDSEAPLKGKVLPNSYHLFIGKSPYHAGINGALDDLRIYGLALTPDDVAALARSRNAPAASDEPLDAYLRVAYEALLLGAGTSYEEIRALPPQGSADRLRIAERLGLLSANSAGDDLDSLLSPAGFVGANMEGWLFGMFDLPSTEDLLPVIRPWRGWLLQNRQDSLTRKWMQEDSTVASAGQQPALEPDLVDLEDLAQSHKTAAGILRTRAAELATKWVLLRASATTNVAMALREVFKDEIRSLDRIESADTAGRQIEAALKALSLTFAAFRRIRKYQALTAPLSEREKDDLAHLLTGVWKLRECYPQWLQEESALPEPIWPTSNNAGAFVAGHAKRDFLPWRGTVSQRTAFEPRIAARLSDWRTLAENHERAVLDAQRIALPVLRDRLLGIEDLPSAADHLDELTERLLVDVGASGATTLTLIDQATLTLQSLVNGIRTNRFESGHPAFNWKIKTNWTDPPIDDSSLTNFDEEWTWLGSYGAWRSAMMVFLYPENALYPELRPQPSTPNGMSEVYAAFLQALRTIPLTSDGVSKLSGHYSQLLGDDDEQIYFLPVSIALALEKAGLFTLALDWYRKVFDSRKKEKYRPQVSMLLNEHNTPPAPTFGDRWALDLNPHTIASQIVTQRGGNPYTRFTLGRIISCMIALADSEFARGTRDSREKALSLYLEAKQLLGFNELADLAPATPEQAYLPNPVFTALRMHVAASLSKIRRGLSYIGTPMLADPTRESRGAQVSALSRPTPYPFKILLERSRQLTAQAQNVEAQYFAALVQRDVEEEKFRREAANVQIAQETVSLRSLQAMEAVHGLGLANLQKARTQIQRDRYQQWISAGPNQNEKKQIDLLWRMRWQRENLIAIDTNMAINAAATNVSLYPWSWAGATVATHLLVGRAFEQADLNNMETQAQVSNIIASQERRQDEWQLQVDLGNMDLVIGDQQITLALDRAAIAGKESQIAKLQRDQAIDMLTFLSTKFTSREFYDWLQGVLAEIYASLLRMATATAQQAERQLAFQRQQTMASIIKQNYWAAASDWNSASTAQNTPDRRGITGSARLLQDITTLDQYAFDSEKRRLNLNQTFSLSRLFPIEFETLRKTGVLSFATTLGMFDEGFPGHYMRLIKKVRVSVIALIPPTLGIRATLSTGGLSRVVTGDPGFPTVVIRQDPQAVALSSPATSTGVFELDAQSDMLYPFEGMGVDANWVFELPPAGNPFDFDTLFDVLLTFDYTALSNTELRERTVKQLPSRIISDRSWSVRRELPDVWYDLTNQTSTILEVSLPLSKADFPAYLGEISIEEVLISIHTREGEPGDFSVTPSFVKPSGEVIPPLAAPTLAAPAVQGVASSRQSGAANWRTTLLSEENRSSASTSTWRFELADKLGASFSLSQELKNGRVDDILIVMTFGGRKPAWTA